MLIVIDKCWLQANGAADVQALMSQHRFVMPSSFFLEVLSDKNEGHMADTVRKFGSKKNPGACIHIPHLLTFELEHKQPALPVEQFLKEDFYFNFDLTKPGFPFLQEDIGHMATWDTKIATDVEHFKQLTAALTIWLPELKDFRCSGPIAIIDDAMERVGRDREFVLAIIDRFRTDKLPPTELMDERWAIFRWTQLRLLGSLEFIRRYGANNTQVTSQLLHNDVIDLDYLTAATLVGAFATKDKIPRRFFCLACPDGVLIPG